MDKIIKYEDLFGPIKKEITGYFKAKSSADKNLDFEHAMVQWFSEEFNAWMDLHASKSDRRENQDRRKSSSGIDNDRRKASRRTAQRRKNTRYNIELPVTLVETVQEATREGERIEEIMGESENIRGGGLYFKSREPLKASSIIRVVLDFAKIEPDADNVVASAMVVRSEKLRSGEYGISLMFSKVDEKEKPNLNYMIFRSLAFQKSDLYTLF
ncbi:MAG: PilZ domain-containing protein [Spirochaetes bacterium]|nr:PilZ domain-containing protein [Spirochaetota bacterium]